MNPDSTTTEELTTDPLTTPDDFGYDEPEVVTPPAAPAVPAKAPEVVPPVEAPVSGYVKPAPAAPVVTPPAEPAKAAETVVDPAVETPEQKALKEIETAVSTLGDSYNKKAISEFAVKNKLNKEQVEAYVAQMKADDANEVKIREEKITAQRQAWNEDLVKDPEFGGDNFDKSVHEVESLLGKYFPDTKKVLTDKKGMLPPYFMKDLLRVAKALKPTNQFEGGEPPGPKEDSETGFLDDMYS